MNSLHMDGSDKITLWQIFEEAGCYLPPSPQVSESKTSKTTNPKRVLTDAKIQKGKPAFSESRLEATQVKENPLKENKVDVKKSNISPLKKVADKVDVTKSNISPLKKAVDKVDVTKSNISPFKKVADKAADKVDVKKSNISPLKKAADKVDDEKSNFSSLKEAADKGDCIAQYKVARFFDKEARLFAKDKGVAKSMAYAKKCMASANRYYEKASRLIKKNAEENADFMLLMAKIHKKGHGVTKSLKEAYRYFDYAIMQKHPDSINKRDKMLNEFDSKYYSLLETLNDTETSKEITIETIHELVDIHMRCSGDPDATEIFNLYHIAADECHDASAKYELGIRYSNKGTVFAMRAYDYLSDAYDEGVEISEKTFRDLEKKIGNASKEARNRRLLRNRKKDAVEFFLQIKKKQAETV